MFIYQNMADPRWRQQMVPHQTTKFMVQTS